MSADAVYITPPMASRFGSSLKRTVPAPRCFCPKTTDMHRPFSLERGRFSSPAGKSKAVPASSESYPTKGNLYAAGGRPEREFLEKRCLSSCDRSDHSIIGIENRSLAPALERRRSSAAKLRKPQSVSGDQSVPLERSGICLPVLADLSTGPIVGCPDHKG